MEKEEITIDFIGAVIWIPKNRPKISGKNKKFVIKGAHILEYPLKEKQEVIDYIKNYSKYERNRKVREILGE